MYNENNIKCSYTDDKKIWKYMDLWKFVYIIQTNSLFFSSVFYLEDRFEGTLNDKSKNVMFDKIFSDLKETCSNETIESVEEKARVKTDFYYDFSNNNGKQMYCVNCWHLSDIESYAFWNIYSNYSEGIAIQSTIGNFKKSFDSFEGSVEISEVKYIDISIDIIDPKIPDLYFIKRKEYNYEEEIRALVSNNIDMENFKGFYDKNLALPKGVSVTVDINKLIENIYISPSFPDWKKDVLEQILKKYNIDKNIIKSSL